MPMQIFFFFFGGGGVEAVYYGVVQVENVLDHLIHLFISIVVFNMCIFYF